MDAWPCLAHSDGPSSLVHVDALAEAARRTLGPVGDPVRVRDACKAAMVKVLNRPLGIGQRRHTAMLVPTREGFRAVVDSALWQRAREGDHGRHRLRFVLAHELGHTFFYRPGQPPKRTRPPDRLEERFCHRFATSLLVPPAAAIEVEPDPEGLFGFARKYDVSPRVAAWAIARARPSLTLLWLQHAPHPMRDGYEAMRVEWGASDRFIARGESFKSMLAELAPGEHGEARERLRLAGREDLFDVQAWRFGSSMLAVLKLSDDMRGRSCVAPQPMLF